MITSHLVKDRNLFSAFNSRKSKTLKILIIDDNESITNAISKFLQSNGHECIASNDGRNGLALIQTGKFDVIVLDLSMPEFSGYDILDYLERIRRVREQKILVLSASPYTNEDGEEMKRRGVYACLRKPVSGDVLLSALEY